MEEIKMDFKEEIKNVPIQPVNQVQAHQCGVCFESTLPQLQICLNNHSLCLTCLQNITQIRDPDDTEVKCPMCRFSVQCPDIILKDKFIIDRVYNSLHSIGFRKIDPKTDQIVDSNTFTIQVFKNHTMRKQLFLIKSSLYDQLLSVVLNSKFNPFVSEQDLFCRISSRNNYFFIFHFISSQSQLRIYVLSQAFRKRVDLLITNLSKTDLIEFVSTQQFRFHFIQDDLRPPRQFGMRSPLFIRINIQPERLNNQVQPDSDSNTSETITTDTETDTETDTDTDATIILNNSDQQ